MQTPLVEERPPERYWFPAKRYGWGWGMPSTWQGWVVILVFALVVGVASIAGGGGPWTFVGIAVASLALVVVGYAKGEPPRWRWGGDER